MEHVLVLNGLALSAPAPTTLSLTAGNTTTIERVTSFSLPANAFVAGQKVGDTLQLVGKAAGTATLVYQPTAGTPITLQINVTGLSTPQALALADKAWTDIKSVLNEPALVIDWQDAEVLRKNVAAIRKSLVTLRNTARDLNADGALYEATLLLKILDYAVSHPTTVTLLECVVGAVPAAMTEPSLKRTGRECFVNGGTTMRPLYAHARDYGTVMDVLEVSAIVAGVVAAAVASVVSLGIGTAVAGAVATGAAAVKSASAEIPKFANDPDRLVTAFGGAVCAAINDGALPARVRAAMSLRAKVAQKYGPFQLAKAIFDNPRTSAEEKARLVPIMAGYISEAQRALAALQTLDQAEFFAAKDPAGNTRFQTAASAFRALDVLRPTAGPSGGTTTSVSPVVIGIGVAAAGFFAWKFLL